jgi:hypothetical protein
MSSMQEANPNYYCPITQELMRDPVVDRDGNSYERSAIMVWLERNQLSPITRNPMNAGDLVPNRSLRSSIEDFINSSVQQQSGEPTVTVATEETRTAPTPAADVAMPEFEPPVLTLLADSSRDTESEKTFMVSVKAGNPSSLRRHPATIVCVVDTSGSMCSEAAVQGVESTGLSMLDIVKHAVRTVLTSLNDHDRFGLVTFSTQGKLIFDLTYMTEAGKAMALSKVDSLKTGGSTNLWDGLFKGMEMLGGAGAGAGVGNGALFLLTDGVPSEIPPRGHIPMMQRYRDSRGGRYPGTINTFGFGYSLDSTLLSDMAIEGGGMYAFIPDSGFVGTAFVNALGNHLSSYGKQCVLSVETGTGDSIDEGAVLGYPEHTISGWGVAFKVPNLLSGSSQDFVFTVKSRSLAPSLNVSLAYEHFVTTPSASACAGGHTVNIDNRSMEMAGGNSFQISVSDTASAEDIIRSLWFEVHRLRLSVVDALRTIGKELAVPAATTPTAAHADMLKAIVSDCDAALSRLRTHAAGLAREHGAEIKDISTRISGIKDDIKGQVTEAISKPEWYLKWGKHYLLSLQRAHLLQQCNNFKDPGIQSYGGNLFEHYRDKADDVFMSLPPPTPSRAVYRPQGDYSSASGRGGGGARASAPPAQINMSAYNDMSGGCVHEASVVSMADGCKQAISSLKKGDLVYSRINNGDKEEPSEVSRVVCMVRTECDGNLANLVTLDSGLRVTPWHPVRDAAGHWAFPATLCGNTPIAETPCSYVYTFVLSKVDSKGGGESIPNANVTPVTSYASSMVVDNTECIALGHGIENDSVASHAFLGTQAVINDLQKRDGWSEGLVTLQQKDFQRDAVSGHINRL